MKKIDYYCIIGKMAHTIDDTKIELRGSLLVKENTLKQFSDLFDDAIIRAKRQVIEELEEFITDDSSYWNEYRQDILKRHLSYSSETSSPRSANAEDFNKDFTVQSVSPKVCPKCKKQTLSQISRGEAWGCSNLNCSYIGKPS